MAKKPRRFTVEAGRQILRNGQPFLMVAREASAKPTSIWKLPSPAEIDEVTHVIAALLSRAKTYTYCGETYLVSSYLKGI